ncbi:MAG: aminotransferase class IV [Alphaproteobacteria bacterium]
MAERANERVAYLNGKIVPESQAVVSFRDRSFKFGDAVFDMTRTFGHKIFKLDEHLERLYRSLRYVQIDPALTKKQMADITEEVVRRNLHLIDRDEDYWVGQRVTRGLEVPGAEFTQHTGPTVIVECTPLPLKARASLFRDGIRVVVPAVRRTPPQSLSPRAKSHNYLNLIMADLEAKGHDPESWAVLLDLEGNITEGMGSNFFVVRDGRIRTPHARFVLPGVSRQTVIDLARQSSIPLEETDIDLYDAYTADEVFLTSTSLCICPVKSVNGATISDGKVPGPVTKKLSDAYVKFVGYDFVAQYLKRLDA